LFLRPVLLIEMGFLLLLILCITGQVGFGAVGPNHELVIMSFGNLVALVTDFYALCWVGMWMGLRARSHNRAIIWTLLRILVLPWILWFVLGAAGFFNAASVVPLLVVWFSLSIVNDLFWAWVAKRGLRLRLRRFAAQGEHKASRPKSSKPVLLGEHRAA